MTCPICHTTGRMTVTVTDTDGAELHARRVEHKPCVMGCKAPAHSPLVGRERVLSRKDLRRLRKARARGEDYSRASGESVADGDTSEERIERFYGFGRGSG